MQKHFRVPVLPYLKKYLEKHVFCGQTAPYKLEEDTLIGKQFMSLIIDARKKDMMGDKKIEMTAVIEVELSKMMAERSPSIRKLIPISFYLDKLFKDHLIVWIKSAEHYGIRPSPASKDFLAHFGIQESEYTYDAAYRHWLRYKNNEYNRLKRKRAKNEESNTTPAVHKKSPSGVRSLAPIVRTQSQI